LWSLGPGAASVDVTRTTNELVLFEFILFDKISKTSAHDQLFLGIHGSIQQLGSKLRACRD
jgi:hypothetical protein